MNNSVRKCWLWLQLQLQQSSALYFWGQSRSCAAAAVACCSDACTSTQIVRKTCTTVGEKLDSKLVKDGCIITSLTCKE
jgi:hypothetical protein